MAIASRSDRHGSRKGEKVEKESKDDRGRTAGQIELELELMAPQPLLRAE